MPPTGGKQEAGLLEALPAPSQGLAAPWLFSLSSASSLFLALTPTSLSLLAPPSRSPPGAPPSSPPSPTPSLVLKCRPSIVSCGPSDHVQPRHHCLGAPGSLGPGVVEPWSAQTPVSCLSSFPPHSHPHGFHLPPSLPPSSSSGSHHPPAKIHPRRKHSSSGTRSQPGWEGLRGGGAGEAAKAARGKDVCASRRVLAWEEGPRRWEGTATSSLPPSSPPQPDDSDKVWVLRASAQPQRSGGGRDQNTLCDISKPSPPRRKWVHLGTPETEGGQSPFHSHVPGGPRGWEGSLRSPCARLRRMGKEPCAQPVRNPARLDPLSAPTFRPSLGDGCIQSDSPKLQPRVAAHQLPDLGATLALSTRVSCLHTPHPGAFVDCN